MMHSKRIGLSTLYLIVGCILVSAPIFIDLSRLSVQTSSPLLFTAMSIGLFPDFVDTGFPAFFNLVVASEQILKNPPSFPQDTQ